MKPVIIKPVVPLSTGVKRVWRLGSPAPILRDHEGNIVVMPVNFHLDFWSTPRFFWSKRPPIIGDDTDDIAAWHDFFTRCWRVTGKDRKYVQRLFLEMMLDHPDIGRTSAYMKTLVTWPAVLRSDGMGIHPDPRFNHDVVDTPTGKHISLPEWCRLNYSGA